MTNNLYRFKFTLDNSSTLECSASDILEALKHLERATGKIKFLKVDVTQTMRGSL